MADLVQSTQGARELPESVRALASPPGIDYADRFTLRTDADVTPEQWARAILGDVPNAGERFVWSGLLRLRLSRGRSPDTVAGWRITARGPDWIRLEAASWFLSGNLVVQVTGGHVALSTLLHYDRRVGAVIWPPLSAVHRRLVPRMLHAAAARTTVPPPARATPRS